MVSQMVNAHTFRTQVYQLVQATEMVPFLHMKDLTDYTLKTILSSQTCKCIYRILGN